MAGIYIHIPFCKQSCYYCDFYFTTTTKLKENFIDALHREIALTKDYLQGEDIKTIYFGGGTPSLLSADEVTAIINKIGEYHNLSSLEEVTLEANPDDLTPEKLAELKQTAINRLSIGIQSFFDEDLKWMNRAHNASEANNVVQLAHEAGFKTLTIDLIYGTPTLTDENWQANIDKALSLGVNHISAYALTVEQNTPLAKLIKQGRYQTTDDDKTSRHFDMLLTAIKKAGWEQYEISNYAKNQNYSIHNTGYWQGEKYLGLGPSAHSYNLHQRSWNVKNLRTYIDSIAQGQLSTEVETLTPDQQFNEYVLTSLRTKWGTDLDTVKSKFGDELALATKKNATEFMEKGWLVLENNTLFLTDEGKLFADYIASELFI